MSDPEGGGCPWTRSQDAQTLCDWLGSEASEVSEAIRLLESGSLRPSDAKEKLAAELGDLIFDALMVLHAAERDYGVTVQEACARAVSKVRKRTPYMAWGPPGATATSAAECEALWMAAKREEPPEPVLLPPAVPAGFFLASAAWLPPAARALISIAALLAAGYAGGLAASAARARAPSPLVGPLPDVVHSLLTDGFCDLAGEGAACPEAQAAFVAGMPDTLAFAAIVGALLRILRAARSSGDGALLLLSEVTGAYALLLLVRCASVFATSVPSPSPLCEGGDLPPMGRGWWLAPALCSDLMFSAHAALQIVCAWLWVAAPGVTRLGKVAAACLAAAGAAAPAVLRGNYTSDVVIGAALAAAVCAWRHQRLRGVMDFVKRRAKWAKKDAAWRWAQGAARRGPAKED